MSLSDYEVALVRLLAEIDQRNAVNEDAAFAPGLTRQQRVNAVAHLEFTRGAADRVERMLNGCSPSRDR